MKNLFFVSVAMAIFSGTSISATAQSSLKFIDGIEIERESSQDYIAATSPEIESRVNYLTTSSAPASFSTEKVNALQLKFSLLLNREIEQISNFPLFTFINDWYETRYRYGGTTKKGVDCSSFTEQLFEAVYLTDLPRTAREQFKACTRIDKEEMAEGDLVFFNTRGGVSHCGVYLGDGYFVHASSSQGVTISHLDEAYFAKRFLGAGRILPSEVMMAKHLL